MASFASDSLSSLVTISIFAAEMSWNWSQIGVTVWPFRSLPVSWRNQTIPRTPSLWGRVQVNDSHQVLEHLSLLPTIQRQHSHNALWPKTKRGFAGKLPEGRDNTNYHELWGLEIKRLAGCDLPKFFLQRYRKGHMDNLAVDVPVLGSCLLSYQVGDPKLPPVVEIGRPIRKFFYGLLSPLMGGDRKVVEFHRNKVRWERTQIWCVSHNSTYRGYAVGVASRLATIIYVAMVMPILYDVQFIQSK